MDVAALIAGYAGPGRPLSCRPWRTRAPWALGTSTPCRTRLLAVMPEANPRIHPGAPLRVPEALRVPPKTFLNC
ncbi:hypothetical protein TPB0596_44030 [Tsukamurella pulmonis]|uniref:hypothetical protein n=1 Tax=Tsukamurella pulmonis TaxID=47312 RepID=UPI001EE1414F|nr:hypothetical protein [Tsukamurella pulmonis]BDD84640.1 hypothetical protein TPB0596_44030 [Tsukamurella pulmonis]